MIDLDRISANIAMVECEGDIEVSVTCELLREIITRLRQAEKDAARYRWLRDTADVAGTADLMISIIVSDEWDSLIDEAMQCK